MYLIIDKIKNLLPLFKGIPVFAGVIGSLFFCSLFAAKTPVYKNGFAGVQMIAEAVVEAVFHDEVKKEEEIRCFPDEHIQTAANLFKAVPDGDIDLVLKYFRTPEYREWVTGFFSGLCSNAEIARAVLENTDKYNVSPALAFALIWEESKYDPHAINRHNRDGSIDRGLFQLNNRSFPGLEVASFYDINISARYGVGHLRHCLDNGVSEVSALAMYNAGTGRVRNSGTPQATLDYASRILENRSRIESRFHVLLIKEEENRLEENSAHENLPEENHLLPDVFVAEEPQFTRILITASPL
ncbi:MAG: lytic transglycosylase domain-containing protein [Treponema sp.]|jgi:hypothetical protein|nr:lytic transglycosylase domain-containing protein [Treponema sp.]